MFFVIYRYMNQTKNNMKNTKTIFKGVINGVEFDNVADYNKRLTELLSSGENVEAMTSTSTKNIQDEDVRMLPGFDKMESDRKSYVNNYVTGNYEADSEKLSELVNSLDSNLEKVIHKVLNMDYAALKEYEQDVKNVLSIIEQDMTNTDNAIKSKTQEFEVLDRELKVLKTAMNVLKLWNENYKAYFNAIKDAYTAFDETCEKTDGNGKYEDNGGKCKCNCECECKRNKDEGIKTQKSSCEDFADVLNDIMTFFKEFNSQNQNKF